MIPRALSHASILWSFVLLLAVEAGASDRGRERAEEQIERISVYYESLQADPERQVPAAILKEARGIVIIHETRAGLILGGKGGSGVVLVRDERGWGAPALFKTSEGGIGLQAGWQRATFVQILMSEAAVQAIRTNQFRMGVGLRVTSGPRSVGDEAKTSPTGSDVLIYADTGGLYGGVSVEGGSLRADSRANRDLYGMEADAVLFGARPAPTAAGRRLVELIAAPAARGAGGPK